MAKSIIAFVGVFPIQWQQLWGEQHTLRCMTCGDCRPVDSLAAITVALKFSCPRCGGMDLNAYDAQGMRASVRCGTGHGSALGVFGCMHLKNFMIEDEQFIPPLYVPERNEPVMCHACETTQRRAGKWDVAQLGQYCLFCMGAILEKAHRNHIPIQMLDINNRYCPQASGAACCE